MAHNRTNLGPLTTTFTQPPACTYAVAGCTTCNTFWSAQTCIPTGARDDASCWPSTSQGVSQPPDTLHGWGFYSPGIVCPTGFVSACSATAGGTSDWPVQFKMNPGETAVGCCPSGFKCTAQNLYGGQQTCIRDFVPTIIPTVVCSNGTSAAFGQMTISAANAASQATFYAPMIQLNWQSSDRPATQTTDETSTRSTQPPSTTPTANIGGPGNHHALTIGAIVGIVVAIIAAIIIGTSAIIWKVRRGRSLRASQQGMSAETDVKELDSVTAIVYEMSAKDKPVELPCNEPMSRYH